MRPVDNVLRALEARGCTVRVTSNGWEAQCPCADHPDRTPSMQIAEGNALQVLMVCRGCGADFNALCAALGLDKRECFVQEQPLPNVGGGRRGTGRRATAGNVAAASANVGGAGGYPRSVSAGLPHIPAGPSPAGPSASGGNGGGNGAYPFATSSASASANGSVNGAHGKPANGSNGSAAASENGAQHRRPKRYGFATTAEIQAWPEFGGAYVYENADGTPRFTVIRSYDLDEAGNRLLDKDGDPSKYFAQWRFAGAKGWASGLSWKDATGHHKVPTCLYRLPEIMRTIASGQFVGLVEGEKDVETLARIGIFATCNPMGAGKWQRDYSTALAGAHVFVIPDNDKPGRDHVAKMLASLPMHAESVRVVNLPNLPLKGDVTNWINDGHTAEELWGRIFDATPYVPGSAVPGGTDEPGGDGDAGDAGGRPCIVSSDRQMDDVVKVAMQALTASNTPTPSVFVRSDMLIRVRPATEKEPPAIDPVSPNSLRMRMAESASWFTTTPNGRTKGGSPPLDIVHSILALPAWPFPRLAAVISTPVFADGALVTANGYHEKAELYLHTVGLEIPPIPDAPSEEDLTLAKWSLMGELLGDFPFVDEASRAHTVAAILHPFIRPMIPGPTPLHLVDAPAAGTGKGLMIDCVSIVGTGHAPMSITESKDEDEWRKRITSALLAAPTYLLIDNLRRKLDSAQIASATTTTIWTDRLLGASRTVSLPVRCCWMATGNNTQMSKELTRRVAMIRLDARVEQPFNRTGFRHEEIREYALEHRAILVWSALVIIKNWIVRGACKAKGSLGSYEQWSKIMGGVLGAAGITGFLENAQSAYERMDYETDAWRMLVGMWYDKFFPCHIELKRVGVKDLYDMIEDSDGFMKILGNGDDRSRRTALGMHLARKVDNVIGGCKIVLAGKSVKGAQCYTLEVVEPSVVQALRAERWEGAVRDAAQAEAADAHAQGRP